MKLAKILYTSIFILDKRTEIEVGKGIFMDKSEDIKAERSCLLQAKNIWLKSPTSLPHSHVSSGKRLSLAKCKGMHAWPSLIRIRVEVISLPSVKVEVEG